MMTRAMMNCVTRHFESFRLRPLLLPLLIVPLLVGCGNSERNELGSVSDASEPLSLLITNAYIIDGTGADGINGDLRINDGVIVELGDLEATDQDVVYDAKGLVLAPGFIDTHSHMDGQLADRPDVLAALSQGITTMVVGQDGGSQSMADLEALVAKTPIAANIATYTGHGTLRREVLGDDSSRQATPAEIEMMAERLAGELVSGSLGLSTGLEYEPGIYSTTDELIHLAKVVAEAGGRFISHMRSEDRALFEAVDELIEIGRQSGVPVQISHIKLARVDLWGSAGELLNKLDRARHEGIDVTADIYPYTFWQSTLRVLLPERDYYDLAAARYALEFLAKPEGMTLSEFVVDPSLVGKTIAEIAELRETDPAETYLALIREAYEGVDPTESRESVISVSMFEEDISALVAWEHTNLCSDGASAGGHPRGYGSFPRALRMFVREQQLLDLPEMVRKMTSLSAKHVGLRDRGILAAGKVADLVLFNPETITDNATMENSTALSTGIHAVWVDGQQVFEGGVVLPARPGVLLKRPPEAIGDGASTQATKTLDEHLAELAGDGKFNGAFMVAADGVVEYARAFGVADELTGRKLNVDSLFELGSVGKAFTAAAILLLVDEGVLDLEDRIVQHLPTLAFKEATIRQLLNHTGGLPDYIEVLEETFTDQPPEKILENEEVIAWLSTEGLEAEFPAGDQWSYSNTGYLVLASVVEAVSGATFETFVADRIAAPLGIPRTGPYTNRISHGVIPVNYAYPHLLDAGAQIIRTDTAAENAWAIGMGAVNGDGTVISTMHDMAKWSTVWLDSGLLSEGALIDAFTPSPQSAAGENRPYGMAWSIVEDGDIIAHSGGWLGIAAQYVVNRKTRRSALIVINVVPTEGTDADRDRFDRLRELLISSTR